MTSTIFPTCNNYYPLTAPAPESPSSLYTLQWRRGQLLVKSWHKSPQPYLPSLNNQQLLVECLKHSPINLVTIDATVGETVLKFWAEACQAANKPIFLRRTSHGQILKSHHFWGQFIDRVVAGLLLLLLIPIIAIFIVPLQIYTSHSLLTDEWYVGEKGKLFRALKFSFHHQPKENPFSIWLSKSGLEHLPKLWNVYQGDIRLINPHCWSLQEILNG